MANVIVYSTDTCPFCKMAEEFLAGKKIKFRHVNVGFDQKGLAEMVAKSGQTGVPVLDIDGKIIVGFNEPAIRAALKI